MFPTYALTAAKLTADTLAAIIDHSEELPMHTTHRPDPTDPNERAWDAALVNALDASYDYGRADDPRDPHGTVMYDPDNEDAFICYEGAHANPRRVYA